MSRNTRQKFPPTPVKPTRRLRSGAGSVSSSSSPGLSSDEEGYSAVENISDSDDDDEEGVYAAEEEHIIADELRIRRRSSSPRPQQSDDDDADEEDEEDADEEDDDDDDDVDLDDGDEDQSSWLGVASDAEANPGNSAPENGARRMVKRQVRFAGVPDSDSDSTTTELTDDADQIFPSLFIDENRLDPHFHRQIHADIDEVSSTNSMWDYQEDYGIADSQNVAFLRAVEYATTTPPSGSSPELDGYESEGDTTEEDIPEPLVRRKQVSSNHVSETSESEMDRRTRSRRGRPRASRFDLDTVDEKPVAFMHPGTRKMIILTPRRAHGFDLSPETFRHMSAFLPHDLPSSPLTGFVPNSMLTESLFANFGGDADALSSSWLGPAPLLALDSASDTSGLGEDAVAAGEMSLNLEDFVCFHADNSGDEAESQEIDDVEAGEGMTLCATEETQEHTLLQHFDGNPGTVGAFRLNQANQQLILSGEVSSGALDFSKPYGVGTLRGIKSGSLETVANTPLTPERRRRSKEFQGSALESPSQKRKATEPAKAGSHKRHRSITEVGNIAL